MLNDEDLKLFFKDTYDQQYNKIIDVKNINETIITNIGCSSIEYCYSYVVYENLKIDFFYDLK